ncbi:cysteine desulfurase family protein [Alicyclobacillus dauci]|uniref:cysteine desulfurase n=1 Tax=Alicyclobacillus dauci TaxID=1475485 RepID=A0ABY6YY52_9BACL|nr:cysteine desulfurase family protein [Alicyclobacillus dauci]WAH35547.1 cysteine desulfurase [Alicyclobacillus dauci]
MLEETIYLDYASTAPVADTVKRRVTEMLDVFGNPSSLHRLGMQAETLLTEARQSVLTALGASSGRLVFTGGGTESNNLAIFGSTKQLEGRGRHIITTAIEHPAVLEPFRMLEQSGWEVTYVVPDSDGDLAVDDFLRAIRPDTVFISAMHVNNETGAILPVQELVAALKDHPKIRLHVDGTQAFGKIPFRMRDIGVDLYTVSAHKIGGLKGTGALYIRDGVRLSPVIYGGGQELGLRSGTENVIGAVAFGEAARNAVASCRDLGEAMTMQARFIEGLGAIPGWTVHQPKHASPYIVNASLHGLRGEVIVHAFESKGLYVSAGSACSTAHGQNKRSHVLTAMGLSADEADASVRFSWTTDTTDHHLESALAIVRDQTVWLQRMVGL